MFCVIFEPKINVASIDCSVNTGLAIKLVVTDSVAVGEAERHIETCIENRAEDCGTDLADTTSVTQFCPAIFNDVC